MNTDDPPPPLDQFSSICMCHTANCQYKPSIRWMSRKNLPHIRIIFENLTIETLLDTGSMIPLLAEEVYDKITPKAWFTTETVDAFGCNGSQLSIQGYVTGSLSFHKNDLPIQAQFYVLRNSTQPCIIPHSWLSRLHAVLDYNLSSLTYEIPPGKNILAVDGSLYQLEHTNDIRKKDVSETKDDSDPDNDDDNANASSSIVQCNNRKTFLTINPNQHKTFTLPKTPIWPNLVSLPSHKGYGFVRQNSKNSKQILTFFNNSNESLQIDLSQPLAKVQKPITHTHVPRRHCSSVDHRECHAFPKLEHAMINRSSRVRAFEDQVHTFKRARGNLGQILDTFEAAQSFRLYPE